MEFVNVPQVGLELLWEFAAQWEVDLKNVLLAIYSCMEFVPHHLSARLTNIGAEVDAHAIMVITESMDNVYLSHQLWSAQPTLNLTD